MNPASPRFQRGVHYVSVVVCTIVGGGFSVFINLGSNENIFSGVCIVCKYIIIVDIINTFYIIVSQVHPP